MQQRFVLVLLGIVVATGAAVAVASAVESGEESLGRPQPATSTTERRTPPTSTTTTTTTQPKRPANARTLSKFTTVAGDISPKSVVASGRGPVTAQNMMYRHTVTAYDGDGKLVATVPDSVRLSDFGVDKVGTYQGAPVEAAFMHESNHVYVSNYAMYGPGYVEGKDSCTPASGVTNSFLYRISTKSWKVDQVVPVGATPKYVAVTPDDQRVLTSNWCTYDLSVSSTKDGRELKRVPLGPYPRGIAVSPDGSTAYVAVMGSTRIAKVNLGTYAVSWISGVGLGPRHLVISPDGRYLFATLNKEGSVVKIDT
ncbi:MAG: YncE family protein, partial [Actinomycetes bacterium]